jgi:DNA (cytosine-5)-methyltransferase 1
MGQGRYVHPSRPRTLTPHEAARLQFFPDFYRFDVIPQRKKWATMIGNAAPMRLSFAFALEILR